MMDPLKLRDMRMPMSMSPAMPSQVLGLVILESVHVKLMEAGGSVVLTMPSTRVHTWSPSSMTYTDACSQHRLSILNVDCHESDAILCMKADEKLRQHSLTNTIYLCCQMVILADTCRP